MIEGNLRHPVTGTPQGGIVSPLLANVYLTAIDERYRRWVPNPRDKTRERAQQRLQSDYKRGRPGFYVVRYADDFVVLCRERSRMPSKSAGAGAVPQRGTAHGVVDGEDQDHRCPGRLRLPRLSGCAEKMPSTGRHVGMLFIPKSKSQLLRDKIKARVRETPTGRTLADLIDDLNPVIMGWRNYYRYATRSGRSSPSTMVAVWRLKAWLGKKHGGASRKKAGPEYAESGARHGKVDGDRRARSSPGSLTPNRCGTRTGDYAYRMDGTTQKKSSAREPISSGRRPSPSLHCEGPPVA